MKLTSILLLLLVLFVEPTLGQPKGKSSTSYIEKVDSLYKTNALNKRISEGSTMTADSLGKGGYSFYTMTTKEDNNLVLATYERSIHYGYDSDKVNRPNTERTEGKFYYKHGQLVYVSLTDSYYDEVNYYGATKYEVDLLNDVPNIYRSETSKKVYQRIMDLNQDILEEDKQFRPEYLLQLLEEIKE